MEILKNENTSVNLENIRHALDQSSIVVIIDQNWKITNVNKKFCQLSKYSESEIIGKNYKDIQSNFHSLEFYQNMWDTMLSGKIWHGDIQNRAKDNTTYWEKTTIVPIINSNGKVIQYISIRTDITEQKQMTDLQITKEKFETIGKLSSRIAHDIRNPLSVIRASVENLKIIYEVDGIKLKNMEKIDRSIDRIAHQIDDVLDFVRQDENLIFNTYSLSEILADALDSIHIPNTIQLELPKNDVKLNCDQKRISIALVNLILNGIQAIEQTGKIKIRFKEFEDTVIIEVEDSGVGIPNNILTSIFEPLFTTKQQGTGLGLSSVKAIITAHNGTISVQSPPTVFTIYFPKKQS